MNLAAKKQGNLYIWALNHENLYKRSLMWREKELTVLNTFIFWKWKMTWTDRSLTQAGGSKTGPQGKRRVFSDNDVVSLLSHISLLQCSSALMCYFVLFLILWNNVMLEQCLWEVIRMHHELQSGCKWQMQKVPFFYKLPNQKAERTLCHACPFALAPLISHKLNSHFLNKTYQTPASFLQ